MQSNSEKVATKERESEVMFDSPVKNEVRNIKKEQTKQRRENVANQSSMGKDV